MENKNEGEIVLYGFNADLIRISLNLHEKYRTLVEKLESNLEIYEKMNVIGGIKFYDDAINNSNASIKGFVADNDSGYISQNVESSNSSVETTNDTRLIDVISSSMSGNVYVNEDALLEKPHIAPKCVEKKDEEYHEFDHLFFMSSATAPVLDASVTSQNTNFSGFEGDESDISDMSGVIPVATPLKVSSNLLNDAEREVNNDLVIKDCIKNNKPNRYNDDSKENNSNLINMKNNLKQLSSVCANDNDKSCNSSENKTTFVEHTSMLDASSNDASFENFYSRLCGLYTRNDFPAEDPSKNSTILSIFDSCEKIVNLGNIPYNSPYKNSYFNLETTSRDSITSSIIQNLDCARDAKTNKNSYIELEGINKKATIIDCGDYNSTKQNPELQNDHKSQSKQEMKTFQTPIKEYKNKINPDVSPELFSDDESSEPALKLNESSFTVIQKVCEQKYIIKNDRELLQRAQKSLCGVLPPPSVTIVQMSVSEMLQKIDDNKHLFVANSNCDMNKTLNDLQKQSVDSSNVQNNNSECDIKESLLVTCKKEDFNPTDWPKIIHFRYHGLHHNRSKISEDFEHLCLKYAERYIGVETQSSCTVFGTEILSPSKRKYKFKRAAKSPGKRLSHLARRRITFSKDSLQSGVGPSSCSFIGNRTRQIMVDVRRSDLLSRRKSPRKKSPRKTPGKSPRKRANTPGSSAKKRLSTRLRLNEEDSLSSVASSSSSRASVTKRALFQSPPDKGETTNGLLQILGSSMSSDSSQSSKRRTPRRALFNSPLKSSPSKMSISSLYPAKRKLTPKRALFMSPEKSASKRTIENYDRKRKRIDSEAIDQPSKISRSISTDVRVSSSESSLHSRTFSRSQSITSSSSFQTQDIVAHRKKKMLWAVAEALRSQNIELKHPQFKVFASVLARLIRHFLPNLFTNGPRPEGSSTESMLRIARQHVFAVTRGKTVDQIIKEVESKVRVAKPSGYVGLDKVDKSVDFSAKNKENVLQDRVNTIGSERLETSHVNKNSRGVNVERIRRVINFGDEDGIKSQSNR